MFGWGECLHEAGHIVGALANGVRVWRAAVASNRAYTKFAVPPDAHTEAVVAFAGPLAQLLYCEDGPDPFAQGESSGSDMRDIAALGLSPAAVASARAEAERLVIAHRSAIGRLANDLSRWGVIDGEEAAILFNMNK